VFGEVAKSAECGLFVHCWQGIGRNRHGIVGVKEWYKFMKLSHSRFISRRRYRASMGLQYFTVPIYCRYECSLRKNESRCSINLF
jgi:hypothetical protein